MNNQQPQIPCSYIRVKWDNDSILVLCATTRAEALKKQLEAVLADAKAMSASVTILTAEEQAELGKKSLAPAAHIIDTVAEFTIGQNSIKDFLAA